MTIEEYINSLEDDKKSYVNDFIDFMKVTFPNITPKICFAMPMWWFKDKMYEGYIGLSIAKNHYSIHFHDEDFLENLKIILPKCHFGKRCINIKYNDSDSIVLINKLITKNLKLTK